MNTDNKGIKIVLIVLVSIVWLYAISELIPVLSGESDEDTGNLQKKTNQRFVHIKNNVLKFKKSEIKKGPWIVDNTIAFFRRSVDPFVPFLVPRSSQEVKRITKKTVQHYKLPKADKTKAKPVTTVYRLSSILTISKQTTALLTSAGSSYSREMIRCVKGTRLPGGEVVIEVNSEKQYILLLKKGHVFRLTPYAPWIELIKKPKRSVK
ncbi:MAG: hypothetical protein KAS64_07360 [Spirochaetes bacterium]|nr:hypothetical protein [Spirochaetota bacterium]